MKKTISVTKVGITQVFNENGALAPVAVLQARPCVITQVRATGNDDYKVVQVGFVDKRDKLASKPQRGHFDKAGVSYKGYVRELRFENAEKYSIKDEIKTDVLAAGDKIGATAISKGKDFRGAIRRYRQRRRPIAHGSKFRHHQGSNGSVIAPGRAFRGRRMSSRMDNKQITAQDPEVAKVGVDNDLILVRGAVPRPEKSLMTVEETAKVER